MRLTKADVGWRDVPDPFSEAVRHATTQDDVLRAMTQGPSSLSPKQQERQLQPASGAPAVLVPAVNGLRALDLATGWGKLDDALGSLGAEVTAADWCYTRLRFRRLLGEPGADTAVHIDPRKPLPFPDGAFDVVFVDALQLEQAFSDRPDGVVTGSRVLLAEVHRVLAEDGTLVYGSRNPLRRRHRLEGAGHLARTLRDVLRPWGQRRLAHAGFTVARVLAASPRRGSRYAILPLDLLPKHLLRVAAARSAGNALKRRLGEAVVRVGMSRWLVSDYFVVAHRSTAPDDTPAPLVETLHPSAGADAPVQLLSDERVAVLAGDEFVKFPLSPRQQDALLLEEEKTDVVRTTSFAPYLVPWSRVETWKHVPYVVSPRMEQRGETFPGEALAVLSDVLERQQTEDHRPLTDTAVWRRLNSRRGQDDLATMGAQTLYRWLTERYADHRVPVGPTHGDLHVDNVLLSPQGPVLVDWNRFELDNPLFLDPAYAAVRAHERAARQALSACFAAFADGELDDPLAARADETLGELDRLSAAVLMLLDRIVSYSEPRERIKPWTIRPLADAVQELSARLRA
ncbi:MAG: phosphotransferase [Actinomycetes bacterium]